MTTVVRTAIRPVLRYRNPDSTRDINSKTKAVSQKGILTGGAVVPVVGQMRVAVEPFEASSVDGMTVVSSANAVLDVAYSYDHVIIGRFKYAVNTIPTAQVEILTQEQYDLDPDQSELVVFATIAAVNLPDTEVPDANITYTSSHRLDQIKRATFRGVVLNAAALPTGKFNLIGDVYWRVDIQYFVYWNGSAWIRATDSAANQALLDHINNVTPDAKHITDAISDALNDPGFSEPLSSVNPVVESKRPLGVRTIEEIALSSPYYQIALTGRYFVGTGAVSTGKNFFFLTKIDPGADPEEQDGQFQLTGSDGHPITILGVYPKNTANPPSAPTPSSPGPGSMVNPSVDADADGCVTDPVVRLNFEFTTDNGYNGTVRLLSTKYGTVGQSGIANIGNQPVNTYPHAELVPIVPNWNNVNNAQDTVQKFANAIDQALATEIVDRTQGDIDAIATIRSASNTFTGVLNTFNKAIRLGADLVADAAQALTARVQMPIVASGTATYTFLYEIVRSGGPPIYVYASDDSSRGLTFIQNAVWTQSPAQWTRVVAGQPSFRLQVSSSGGLVYDYHPSGGASPWGDAAWDTMAFKVDGATETTTIQELLVEANATFDGEIYHGTRTKNAILQSGQTAAGGSAYDNTTSSWVSSSATTAYFEVPVVVGERMKSLICSIFGTGAGTIDFRLNRISKTGVATTIFWGTQVVNAPASWQDVTATGATGGGFATGLSDVPVVDGDRYFVSWIASASGMRIQSPRVTYDRQP